MYLGNRSGEWSQGFASGRSHVLAMVKAALEIRIDCEDSLLAALHNESETVRRTAARALLGLSSVRGLAAVVAGNKHRDAVRTAAARSLAEFDSDAAAANPALFALLNDRNIAGSAHFAASRALGALGSPAIPYRAHAMRQGSSIAKYESASTLRGTGRTAGHNELIDRILGPDENDATRK